MVRGGLRAAESSQATMQAANVQQSQLAKEMLAFSNWKVSGSTCRGRPMPPGIPRAVPQPSFSSTMEARGLAHRGLAWLFILLAFVGFVLMLSGVASMQQVILQAWPRPSKAVP